MTTHRPLDLPPDAVDDDGNDIFESNHGVRFLSSPEAKFANVPAPTPEEIERDFRNVSPAPDSRVFMLRTMQARQLWLGRLPPTRPGEGVRIPGISFAHFILTGLTPSRPTAIRRMIRTACGASTDASSDSDQNQPASRQDLHRAVAAILDRLDSQGDGLLA